jgi:hypothetical protein
MSPLEERLAALAAAGETTHYGALARALGLRMGELTFALETLMAEDAAAGRPLRAALLHQRLSPDALPAPGFFQTAAALGLSIPDPAAFVADQRRALHAAFTRKETR